MGFMRLHTNIKIRIITSALMRFGSTTVFPFMAIYFSEKLGQTVTGLILGLNVFITVLASLCSGYITDRIGYKKVLIISQALQVIAYALMTVANSRWFDSIWLTFFMMSLQSGSSGFIIPAAEAMLIEVCKKEDRRLMYTIDYWSTNLSIGVGIILGGILFQQHRFELFVVITGISLLGLGLYSFFTTETICHKYDYQFGPWEGLKNLVKNYKDVLADRIFLWYALGNLLAFSLQCQTSNYISVRLASEFIPVTISFCMFSVYLDGYKILSWMEVENNLLVIIGVLVVSNLLRKFKDGQLICGGMMVYTLGFVLLSVANNLLIISVAILIATIGELIYTPVRQSILANVVKDNARSSYLAINSLTFYGGRLLGSIGITLGAFMSSWVMGGLIFLTGLLALYCFVIVTDYNKKVYSERATM